MAVVAAPWQSKDITPRPEVRVDGRPRPGLRTIRQAVIQAHVAAATVRALEEGESDEPRFRAVAGAPRVERRLVVPRGAARTSAQHPHATAASGAIEGHRQVREDAEESLDRARPREHPLPRAEPLRGAWAFSGDSSIVQGEPEHKFKLTKALQYILARMLTETGRTRIFP